MPAVSDSGGTARASDSGEAYDPTSGLAEAEDFLASLGLPESKAFRLEITGEHLWIVAVSNDTAYTAIVSMPAEGPWELQQVVMGWPVAG